jgi:hypothetical protein
MSLKDFQNFLAKLYTSEEMRQRFIDRPFECGRENNLTDAQTREIIAIFAAEIEAFAESLVQKRLRETERFLPLTKKMLGAEFGNLFRVFIRDFTPQTVQKHLEDAFEFAKFLERKKIKPDWIGDVVKLELAGLEHNGYGKKLVVKRFDYDIRVLRQYEPETETAPEKRNTYSIWLRFGRRHRHFVW